MTIPKNLGTSIAEGTLLGICFFLPFFSLPLFHLSSLDSKWLLIRIGLTLFCIVSLARPKAISLPVLGPNARVVGSAVFAMLIANFWILNLDVRSTATLDRILFVLSVLFSSHLLHTRPHLFKKLLIAGLGGSTVVIFYGLFQIMECHFPIKSHPNCFAPFFGNINMSAQFLILSALGQILLLQGLRNKSFRAWGHVALTATFFYILVSGCRSVYLAMVLLFPTYAYSQGKVALRNMTPALIAGGIFFIVFQMSLPSESKGNFVVDKDQSASIRFETWEETWNMLKSHPQGVGSERYEFASVPFLRRGFFRPNPDQLMRTPHNELLRFAVEDGVVTLLGLVIFFWLLIRPDQWLRDGFRNNSTLALGLLGTVLASEGFFQFPMRTPYPFFITVLYLSYFLSENKTFAKPVFLKTPHLFTVPTALALIFFMSGSSYAQYAEAHGFRSLQVSGIACKWLPSDWRPCLNSAKLLFHHDPEAAFSALRTELSKRPYNFFAIKIWSDFQMNLERKPEGCRALLVYDQLLSHQTHQSFYLSEYCADEMEFLEDNALKSHKKWLLKNKVTVHSPF